MFLRRLEFRDADGVYAVFVEGGVSIGDSLPVSDAERGGFVSAIFIFL
jgi:hypothetical protein